MVLQSSIEESEPSFIDGTRAAPLKLQSSIEESELAIEQVLLLL